eukprot:8779654-Pyramimonas_sp.AAC.1
MIPDTFDEEAASTLKYSRWEKNVLGVALESREVTPCIQETTSAGGRWFPLVVQQSAEFYPGNREFDELILIPPVLNDLEAGCVISSRLNQQRHQQQQKVSETEMQMMKVKMEHQRHRDKMQHYKNYLNHHLPKPIPQADHWQLIDAIEPQLG